MKPMIKTEEQKKLEARTRYVAAAHAMQSGVKADQALGSNDGTPKHLRVGINTAHADISSLTTLLIQKGLFTELEYLEALADGMEREKARYEALLSEKTGQKVTLG